MNPPGCNPRRGTRRRRWLAWVAMTIGILALPVASSSTVASITQTQDNDEAYEDQVHKGRDLLRRHNFEEALKSFKRANEMRGRNSAECFYGMAEAYQGLQAFKNVVTSCDKVIELAGNDAQLQTQAYNLKGCALQVQAEGKNQKKLQEAEAVFRQGLGLGEYLPILHYNLGFILMQEGHDAEGIIEIRKFVDLVKDGPKADEARKLIENPRRARESYAPDFSITTADGQYVTLEDLHGKVVFLDFWGTWCPPCVESVPSLRDLYKRFSKEPAFVMISVSVNDEEANWREFTAKNRMTWPQYFDRDDHMQQAFDVRMFPTYIVIDHEGIVRYRSSGVSFRSEGELADAIKKQMKIVAKTAPSG
jgi:peroxiredoxin/Tfp pilus assembly protein PilF